MLAGMNTSRSSQTKKRAQTQGSSDYADYSDYDLADYAGDLDYPPSGSYAQAYNAGVPLSGGAVSVAWKNAKQMVRQGYGYQPDGVFFWHGGRVLSPLGKCYDVYLPGAYPDHAEGKCSCPFFSRHAICKHIYFAVEQTEILKALAPAIVEQADKAYRERQALKDAQNTVQNMDTVVNPAANTAASKTTGRTTGKATGRTTGKAARAAPAPGF